MKCKTLFNKCDIVSSDDIDEGFMFGEITDVLISDSIEYGFSISYLIIPDVSIQGNFDTPFVERLEKDLKLYK